MSINTAVFPQQGQPIPLGRQGESNARTIVFEIYGWLREYGEGGTFLLLHKRPNDQAAYLVPFTMSPNGTEIFWKVSAVDTDKDTSGSFGEAELRYEVTTNDGTTKVKSDLYRTMVAKSLDEYNPRYPDVPEPEGGGLILRPVLERPTIGEENVVYLVPNDASEDPENVYVEWIYVNNAWEEWGKYTADVDIASKADLSYVNAQLELKQDKISATGTNIKPVYFSSAGTATPIPGYVPDPSNDNPLMDGTASPGTSTDFSRKDHRHPHDSTKQDKLVATGSAVQGVYVSASGEVSTMTYSLNKTVPANAAFTDTTYDPATSSTNGLMTSTDKAKLDRISLPAGGVSLPVILSNQSVANFNSAAAGRPLRVTVNIVPQQSGSGDPSPSNVRPITGWTGASVCRTSENLLPPGESGSGIVDEVTISSDGAGTYRLTGGPISDARSRKFFFPTIVLPTDDCYLHIGNSSANIQIACVLGNDDSDIGIITPALISVNRIFKITAPAGSKLKWISFYFNSVSNVGDMTVSPMIMRSDSPTAFKPCSLQNIAVSFPSSAGTVYGGTLDVARGLLTVTHMLYSFTGNESVSEFWAEGGYFSMLIPHMFIWGNTIVSSHYHYEQFDSWPSWSSVPSDYFIGAYSSSSGNTNLLRIKDSALAASDPSEFSTKIQSYYRNQAANGTPVQCVLEVNPITYQLTPRQIVSLAGTNNVFADCGNVTVTHWPGTGTPIEPVEDASEIEWKKGILARIEALEAGE